MFTTTTINIPMGSVTFYQREGTIPSVEMEKVMNAHKLLAIPNEGGGIPHTLL